eukprot:scaffold186701_cov17-Tisochrysis_lutea.AAC.2
MPAASGTGESSTQNLHLQIGSLICRLPAKHVHSHPQVSILVIRPQPSLNIPAGLPSCQVRTRKEAVDDR